MLIALRGTEFNRRITLFRGLELFNLGLALIGFRTTGGQGIVLSLLNTWKLNVSKLLFLFLFLCHRLYKFYNKPALRALVYFCVWLNLCLALFEAPAVSGMALPYWVRVALPQKTKWFFCSFREGTCDTGYLCINTCLTSRK